MTDLEQRLSAYVSGGASSVPGAQSAFIQECLAEAAALVNRAVGLTGVQAEDALFGDPGVPLAIWERAVIEVGADLFYRKQAPQGVSQFTAIDGSAIRLRRDPMDAARTILSPWLPGGFA